MRRIVGLSVPVLLLFITGCVDQPTAPGVELVILDIKTPEASPGTGTG